MRFFSAGNSTLALASLRTASSWYCGMLAVTRSYPPQLAMARGNHAAIRRGHGGIAPGGRSLAATRLGGGTLRLGGLVVGLRLVHGRRAHEFLLHQPLRALV